MGIWSTTLGRADFGVEDNFFELGGDSLHAVHILGRLREVLNLELSAEEALELLFGAPTIAEFADAVGPALAGGR
jgi:acyl carrier protein